MSQIKLHQFPPPPGLPVSASPYCSKVEVYLRLTGREFETVDAPDPRKSPSKMVPWVTWADGSTTPDSSAIIQRLEGEGPGLDGAHSDEDRARAAELVKRVDEPIYFSSLYSRFAQQAGWDGGQKQYIASSLPWIVAWFVPGIVRKGQVARCAKNGFASDADYAKAVKAVGEVSEFLGDKPFLLGDTPSVADCAVWAQLVCCLATSQSTPPRDAARGDSRITAYVGRVAERAKIPLPSWG